MGKILALCGKKSSGKNTLCSFLHGYQLRAYKIIDDFDINEAGELTIFVNDEENGMVQAKIDVTDTDDLFGGWAAMNVWPYVKHYSFASAIKEIAEGLFNVPHESLYGTEEQKNQIVPHLLWENMPGVITMEQIDRAEMTLNQVTLLGLTIHNPGPMTGRQFMQFFGTEIGRRILNSVWTGKCLDDVKREDSKLSIISDCRFDNEAQAVKDAGGKTILLTRSITNTDTHASENGFVNFKDFDAVIDNKNLSLKETFNELLKAIDGFGWFDQVAGETTV